MKPYYSHNNITIYNADCREVLPTLGPVDLVLTDPPYGISLANHDTTGRTDRVAISTSTYHVAGDESSEAASYVLEWAKDLPLIMFASWKNVWPGEWRQWLVWDKGGAVGGGGDVAKCWKYDWELIQVARTGTLNGSRDCSVLRHVIRQNDLVYHPTQKPLSLMAYLIGKASNFGDLLLDPFMGSGSTLVAAKRLGRSAIGIEISEEYCEIAALRLEQEMLPFTDPLPEPEQQTMELGEQA